MHLCCVLPLISIYQISPGEVYQCAIHFIIMFRCYLCDDYAD